MLQLQEVTNRSTAMGIQMEEIQHQQSAIEAKMDKVQYAMEAKMGEVLAAILAMNAANEPLGAAAKSEQRATEEAVSFLLFCL